MENRLLKFDSLLNDTLFVARSERGLLFYALVIWIASIFIVAGTVRVAVADLEKPAFTTIKAGTFQQSDVSGEWDERPVRSVTITRDITIATQPVTNRQFESYQPEHREQRPKTGSFTGDDDPVVMVSWQEYTGHGMFAALSEDHGETWPVQKLLTDGKPRTLDGLGWTASFQMDATHAEPKGYLTAVQTPDGIIHLISSGVHYRFNLAWLKAPPKP